MIYFAYVLTVKDYETKNPVGIMTSESLTRVLSMFIRRYGDDLQGKYILEIQQPKKET